MLENKVKLKNAFHYLEEVCDEAIDTKKDLYDIYYEISAKIFDYRKDNGLTQKKLAEVLGITQAMVSKLESGEYNFTIEQLWKIAKKLGWTLSVNLEGNTKETYSVGYNETGTYEKRMSYDAWRALG